MFLPLTFSLLATSIGHVNTAATLTSTGCADAAGMQKCAADASATFTQCVSLANGNIPYILGCGCGQYVTNFNYYASHCWNRVFECEYQAYIGEYFSLCSIAKFPVPYFPPPDDAPDSCSCNFGKVLLGIDTSIDQTLPCQQNQSILDADVLVRSAGCECCGLSGSVSSIYNFCPQTDPSLIGLSAVSGYETILGRQFNSCSTSLSQFNCVSDFGYNAEAVGGTFLLPESLPASGTATPTNFPGKVTSPASGTVFTYTNGGDGQVYTISAANAKGGGGGGGSSSGSGIGGTIKSGPATKISLNHGVVLALLIIIVLNGADFRI